MANFTSFRPCSGKIRCLDYKYHVFLSFRGPDVRKSFVDHLFRALKLIGIHAFLDTEKLEKGEIIELSLEEAIENSAILIPIFSSGYAMSTWCLEEVRHMWKCRSRGLIIPLFYGVEPSCVRYPLKEKGTYAAGFEKHRNDARFEPHIIEEWKDALHDISSLSGWSLHMFQGYEGRLVDQVVSDITALNFLPRPVPQNVVGLEHHVRKMKEILALHLIDRTIRVCIWGIGGIGKTTLSNAIFNDVSCNFRASCFLSDIRAAQDHGGIIGLQTQMLKDLSNVDIKVNDIDHGKSLLQFHLRSIRCLVILDNVDHGRQLENFRLDCCAAGSRIIMTTRDCGSLNINIPPENIYELQGLQQGEALQLFSWHAFHKAEPDDPYRNLSTKIVKASGGIPLALEVLGAFLRNKRTDDKYWVQALRKLRNLSYPEIFQSLKISYDSLLPSEKEIFLDIACYFIDQDREEPTIFWEELGLDVDTALDNLQQKLLIKIGNDNRFRMHDFLRDLGRAIVADESPGNPGKRSRLWKQEDVQKLITEEQGTESVKYLLHVQESEGSRWKKKCLASMNGLRYLCFTDTILMEGDATKLSPDLKWFKWKRCSLDVLPSQWNLGHLAILDLSSRSISYGSDLEFSLKQLWDEQSHRKIPKNLRVLRVNWCPNLRRLPSLSNLKCLLKLDLTGCSLITELPAPLGVQAQLYYLELSCCSRLEKLPDCIGDLSELKHLGLAGCSSLKALPYSIGCLQKLQYLNLTRCEKLEQLPTSITKLSCLQKLVLSYCSNLRKLPETLEGLKSLQIFELKDVFDIEELPNAIGNLSRLEKLDLESCLIIKLPASVGHLKHLRCLNMNNCECLCVLPDEIGGFESLEELLVNKCNNLRTLPSNISKLQSLVRLEAGDCDLKSIPENLGELSSLKILHLEYNKFSRLPVTCAARFQLTELVLRGCTELLELPILPDGLVTLDIENCIKLRMLPKMGHLSKMQMLVITNCSDFVQSNILWEVRGLTALEIRHGDGSGETVRLTGEGSWNDRFRAEFEGDMDAPSQTPSVEEKARMTADQMRSEIRASYLHNIALSTDPVFITQQIKQRYTDELVNIIIEGDKSEEKEALRIELGRRIQSLQTYVPFVTSYGQQGDGCCAQPSSHDEVRTPPSVAGPLLPTALSATRGMQTSSSMPSTTVDRPTESSTAEADPFPGAVRVITTGSYEGTLLLNKKTMFPLKERKLPGNNVFFEHLFHMTLRLFGPTIRKRWNLQAVELKNQLIASFDEKFGKNIFDNGLLLKRAAKHIKTVRDQYRRALKDNPKYDRPAMIPPMEWNEIIEDAKEKRLCEDTDNEAAQGRKRLQDTSVATKARLKKFGQHKLGSGGYMTLQSRVGTEFNVEVTDEDRKLALKEGYKVVAARLREESVSLSQESISPNDISQPSYPTAELAHDEGYNVHYSGGEHVEHHAEGVEHVPSVQHVDVAADQNVNVHDVALSEPPLVQQPPAPPKRRSHRNMSLHVPEEETNDVDMDAPMSTFLKRAQKNKKKI